jgi:hypothetical protein
MLGVENAPELAQGAAEPPAGRVTAMATVADYDSIAVIDGCQRQPGANSPRAAP